jgi:subfamily B ATP-binding cassette protein MsbA
VIRSLWRYRQFASPFRWRLALGGILVLIVAGAGILQPWPLKIIVDNVLRSKPLHGPLAGVFPRFVRRDPDALLIAAVVSLLALVVLGALAEYTSTRLLDGVGERMMATVRERLYAHLQRLSLAYHDSQRAGDLTTRVISDVEHLQEMIVGALSLLIPNLAILLGIAAIMIAVDWEFSLLALSVAPLMFFTVHRYTMRIKSAARTARRKESEVASLVTETLQSVRVVQAYTLEPRHLREFQSRNDERMSAGLTVIDNQARLSPLIDVIVTIGTVLVLVVGVHRVRTGTMTLGLLLVFNAYLSQLYKPMRTLSKLASVFSKGQAGAERIEEVLATDIIVPERPHARPAPRLQGTIRFENVTFGYQPNHPVLHDVTLEMRAGERVALVGPTGAGKSTIIGLVPRLYDPWSGRVTIDGVDVKEYTLASLRAQVAFVLQDSILFHGSLFDNIAAGAPRASIEAVVDAARAAYVDEFVNDLPDGYSTIVSERGTTLSGGQRQRIAIARALVRNAPIVILDEPMSSLDSLSERHVMRAVDNLMDGRTVIVIAHRFSTLRDADRIFVVDHGTIVDSGTHAELDAHDGLYRAMYREQIRDVPARPVIDLVVHEKPMDGVIDITTRRIVGPSGE